MLLPQPLYTMTYSEEPHEEAHSLETLLTLPLSAGLKLNQIRFTGHNNNDYVIDIEKQVVFLC